MLNQKLTYLEGRQDFGRRDNRAQHLGPALRSRCRLMTVPLYKTLRCPLASFSAMKSMLKCKGYPRLPLTMLESPIRI